MTMPYDGRRRQAPAYEPGARSPQEFEDEFCEALMQEVLRSSPPAGLPDGLTPEQARLFHGNFLKQLSFFAWKFPSWLMSVASLCPYQDVRTEVIKDCWDEEVGDEDAGGRCHIDLLYDEAEECGVSREEIYDTEPSAAILACIHTWENMTRTLGWLPGFAAIGGLEIIQSEPALRARQRLTGETATHQYSKEMGGKIFHEKLGLPDGTLKFLALHAFKDVYHGGGELALVTKYAHTRQLQDECIWAVRASIKVSGLHFQEIHRLCYEAVGVEPALVGA